MSGLTFLSGLEGELSGRGVVLRAVFFFLRRSGVGVRFSLAAPAMRSLRPRVIARDAAPSFHQGPSLEQLEVSFRRRRSCFWRFPHL